MESNEERSGEEANYIKARITREMHNMSTILLITIDTLRLDAIGLHDRGIELTPNLDSLGRQGVSFTNCITNGDHTKVAFPGLLTSTYGSMYTGCKSKLSPQRPYLPELLREGGYQTAAVITSPLLGYEYGYERGFDIFRQLEPATFGAHWYKRKGMQRLLQQSITHQLSAFLNIDTRLPPLYADAEMATDTAIHILDNHSNSRPMFLWVHYMDVHWPYHREKERVQAAELARSWHDLTIVHKARHTKPKEDDLLRFRELYMEAVQYVDAQIGRLLETTASRADDCIVVVVSDHGEAFWEHNRLGHFSHHLYQEIIQVPFLLNAPGIPGGKTIKEPIQLMDIAPTLLDMAGLPTPESMLGQSLLPLWQNEEWATREYLISEVVGTRLIWVAVMKGQYKLVWSPTRPGEHELYDLEMDPQEVANLRGQALEIEQELLTIAERHAQFIEASRTEDEGEFAELSAEVEERLMALGYIE